MRAWMILASVTLALAACNATDDEATPDGGAGKGGSGSGGTAGNGSAGQGGAGSAGTAGASSAGKGGSGSAGTAGSSSAGKGGSGGKGGAGSAGTNSGGQGGSSEDDAGTHDPCTACSADDDIGWGPNGGFVVYNEHSAISGCDTYTHARTPVRSDMPSIECTRPIPCMGSGLHGVSDVTRALAHPDVKAALAKGMVLFGTDSRPVDGTVFRIEHGKSIIDVGGDCPSSGSGCNAIPAGVKQLASLLRAIDDEQLNLDPCRGKFQ